MARSSTHEPPPRMNIKGVQSFHGFEFYRCFITKFFKTTKYLDQLLLLDVTIKFTNDSLKTFYRIKTSIDVLDFVVGGKFMFEKVDTRHLFVRDLKTSRLDFEGALLGRQTKVYVI